MATFEDEIIREITESAAEGRGADIDDPKSKGDQPEKDKESINKIEGTLSCRTLNGTMEFGRSTGAVTPKSFCGPGNEPEPEPNTKQDPEQKKEPDSCAPKRKNTDQKTCSASKAKKPKKSCSRCSVCSKRRNSSKRAPKKSNGPKKRQKNSDGNAKCPEKDPKASNN